jgi:Uri superfamily endonuclease
MPVALLGDGSAGAYVLHIAVRRDISVVFGRFNGGEPIDVIAGEYVYVGSACAVKGSTSLPRRLLRHATRCTGDPHAIRDELIRELAERALPSDPPTHKTLRWNIDHLIERPETVITGIVAVCTPDDVEREIAEWLADDPTAIPLAVGLGAHDHPGYTHVLRVRGNPEWWQGITNRLTTLL